MSVAAIRLPANFRVRDCRKHAEAVSITGVQHLALFILFFGGGLIPSLQFLNLTWSLGIDGFLLDRVSLVVCVPALILGAPYVFHHGRFAKSLPVLTTLLWISLSYCWVDATERGRSLIGIATLLTTLPLAALLHKTGSFKYCAMLFACGYLGGAVAVQLSGPDMSAGRWGDFQVAGQTVMNSNEIGFLAVTVVMLMYGLMATSSGTATVANARMRTLAFWLAVGASCITLLTVSRSACASLVMAGMGIWWHHARKTVATLVSTPLLLTVIVAVAIPLGVFERWQNRLGDTDTSTFNGRTEIWDAVGAVQRQMGWDWIWGIGIGGIDKALGEELGDGAIHPIDGIRRMHSHNLYLEWIVELGLIGVVLGSWLTLSAVNVGLKLGRLEGSPWRMALFLSFAVFSLAGVPTKVGPFPAVGSLALAMLSPLNPAAKGMRR